MWPRLEDDYMEIGESGWISVGQGCYLNKHNGHTIDEIGREFDKDGVMIFDPNENSGSSDIS